MNAKKRASRRTLKSDLARVDTHIIQSSEYEELPELTEEMLSRVKVKKGGRPRSPNPRKLISLRLRGQVGKPEWLSVCARLNKFLPCRPGL